MTERLRHRDTRARRMAHGAAAALLLLLLSFLAAAVILLTVVRGGRDQQAPDPPLQPDSYSTGISMEQQQQKDFKNPSAMLTAPRGNSTVGEYLAWESDDGAAFCHGGFSYSSGSLVVPRNGVYRVFLQITYESKGDFECPSDELRLHNTVFFIRDTYNKNVPLLSSVETVSCSMEQWSKSLYTSGLFSLEANGRLSVKSLYPELIVKKEYQVFFGAELLPQ